MKDLLITVPYRDREVHLEKFLKVVPEFYERSDITFDIVICELQEGGDWNAGLCNNSIIHYLNNTSEEYKYIYIHHVDVYPLEGSLPLPNEGECITNLGDYGSCILHLQTFLQHGGYGNDFWGWGGEDNDLYQKLAINGVKIIDLQSMGANKLTFDTEFQNHPRPFVGKNYAHNVTLVYRPTSTDKGIYDFYNHGTVVSTEELKQNIHKQVLRPSQISPRETKNNKAAITYVDTHSEFDYIVTALKSGMLYSSREYDMIIFSSDDLVDSQLVKEAIAHGATVMYHTKQIKNSPISMATVERFYAYKKFLQNNEQYTEILHFDAADTLFLRNPFLDAISIDKIHFVQEDVLTKDESWNLNALLSLNYSDESMAVLKESPVVCGGTIYGPPKLFLKLINYILKEYEHKGSRFYYGIDQPIINKLIYVDKIFDTNEITFINTHDRFCINLHTPINNLNYYGREITKPIHISNLRQYAIVHQYNRDAEFTHFIQNFHKTYYLPI